MVPRRRLSALLFVVLASVSFGGSVCNGWQASGMERMACCADEDHPCSQVAADTCCGTTEQRQHATADAALPALNTSLLPCAFASFVLPEPDFRERHVNLPSPRVLGSPPDTHVLLSVFLI